MNKNFLAFGVFIGLILFTIIVFFDYRSKKKQEKELYQSSLEQIEKKRYEDSISSIEKEEIEKINQSLYNQEIKDSIEREKNILYEDSLIKSQIKTIQYKINNNIKQAGCEDNEYSLSLGYDGKISVFYKNKLQISLMYYQIDLKNIQEEHSISIKTKSNYYDRNTGIEVLQSDDFFTEVCVYSIEDFNEAYNKYLYFMNR